MSFPIRLSALLFCILVLFSCKKAKIEGSTSQTVRNAKSLAVTGLPNEQRSEGPHCKTENSKTDVEAGIREFAGPKFKDCGSSLFSKRDPKVKSCMVSSIKSHTAFVARFDVMGKDSGIFEGFSGDHEGHLYNLSTDTYGPCRGAPNCWGCAFKLPCQSIEFGWWEGAENPYCKSLPPPNSHMK